jgi:AcrR family transcriptional regulator
MSPDVDVAEAPAPEARAGRPRDPAVDTAILDATAELFVAEGYAGVSIEGVAARAGVGKATIYRRYADKAQLVVAAVRCGAQIDDELPDTGDVRADLRAMVAALDGRLRGDGGQLLVTFAAERARHPDLAEEFGRAVVGRKREHFRHLIEVAVAQGLVPPGADVELLAELAPALLWHHALHDLGFPDDLPDRIVTLILGAR